MLNSVSLVPCHAYDYDESQVEDAVRQAVALAGGMETYVQPGQRVTLKVNLVKASDPETAVCTHPAVVKAVVKLVQEAGGHPVIADSPGGPFSRGWVSRAYKRSGMTEVAEQTGAELNWDFGHDLLAFSEGVRVKGLEIAHFITQSDVVISLPKLKTHGFMQFTGATKNLFGAIPGTLKVAYHAKFPERSDFGAMLIDILQLIPPDLNIMDGIVGMEGLGPSEGDPFEIGAVLASPNAVAMDIVAAHLVGMDVQTIYPLQAAIERGMHSGNITDITILGGNLGDYHIENFEVPKTGEPRNGLVRNLSGLIKNQMVAAPHSNNNCVGCGVCARACPADAIAITDKRAHMDLKTCIRCYCCHELCPEHAIDLKTPLLGRLFSG